MDGAVLTPSELIFTFGGFTSVPVLVKIDQEMRPWECTQMNRYTDIQMQTSFTICPMLYAIDMGQITMSNGYFMYCVLNDLMHTVVKLNCYGWYGRTKDAFWSYLAGSRHCCKLSTICFFSLFIGRQDKTKSGKQSMDFWKDLRKVGKCRTRLTVWRQHQSVVLRMAKAAYRAALYAVHTGLIFLQSDSIDGAKKLLTKRTTKFLFK